MLSLLLGKLDPDQFMFRMCFLSKLPSKVQALCKVQKDFSLDQLVAYADTVIDSHGLSSSPLWNLLNAAPQLLNATLYNVRLHVLPKLLHRASCVIIIHRLDRNPRNVGQTVHGNLQKTQGGAAKFNFAFQRAIFTTPGVSTMQPVRYELPSGYGSSCICPALP